jgi:hypothetical protein
MVYKLNLGLHKNQQIVYNDPHRFKVVATGRQWGKTTYTTRAAAGISLTKDKSVGMVIAPFASQAYNDYEAIKEFIPKQYIEADSARWLTLTLKNKSKIMMRSGENITAIRGFTLDWVLMDEAAFCDEDVWKVVEPELGPRMGVGWFVSSTNGRNWFYDLYNREQNDDQFKSYHFTTYDNPNYPVSEIERMRKNMPETMFLQEIMAQFLEGGAVFRNLERMMNAPGYVEPVPGHSYVMGVDLAKENDWNVIKIFDTATNTECHSIRNNKLDYSYQKSAVYQEAKRWNDATVIIDKTGVGGSVVEDLQKMDRAYTEAPKQGYLTVIPITFSAVSKPELFNHYLLMSENDMIHLIPDEITKKEHEQFERQKLPSGNYKYAAPKHHHDDCVTSSALAAWGLEMVQAGDLIGRVETSISQTAEFATKYTDIEQVTEWDSDVNEERMGVARSDTIRTLRKMEG